MGDFTFTGPGGGSFTTDTPFAPTGTVYPFKVSKTTTKNKHTPVPSKPHLFTYSDPVFAGNAASFYGLTIPVSLGRRAIVGVPIFVSSFKTDQNNNTTMDFAVSLGYQGAQFADLVATNVSRIWADDTLIFDATTANGWNTAIGIQFKLYKGTEDQMPDPVLEDWLGDTEGIAFRGEIYLMFYDFPLTKYGMTVVPTIRVEIKDTFTQQTNVFDVDRINNDTAVRTVALLVAVDWYRRRIYQFDSAAQILHVYDALNMIELFRFSTVGIQSGGGGGGNISPFPGALYCEPRFGYLITSEGSSNSCIHFCLDPNTGNIVGQFGIDGGSLSNSGSSFVNPTDFCEMTQADKTGDAFIVCVSFFLGDIGVLKLTPAGGLSYAWCPGDVNTIFDVFDAIGEGAINSSIKWCCPGDIISSGLPGSNNDATALCASFLEVTRVVVSVDPSAASGGGSGFSGYQGRHDLLWRPPLGHNINWIFRDDLYDGEFIVLHRNSANNEMFFSRIRINDNLRGKANPDLGTSGSVVGYATTLWQSGPITRMPNEGGDNGPIGSAADDNAINNYNGWQFSNIGSSRTIAYCNTYVDPNLTVLNIQDGTFATYDLANQFLLDGVTIGGTAGVSVHSGQLWDGDAEQFYAWSAVGTSAGGTGGYTFGPARMSPFIAQSGGGIPLYTILGWLMNYAGFDDDDLSISNNLDDTFSGSLVQELGMSVWDMLDDMAKAFQFEIFESEGKVKFTKVGRGASLSITYTLDPDDDLLALGGGDDEGKGNDENTTDRSGYAGFSTERDWNLDAPQTVELRYLDETQEYTVNLARANKTTFPVSTTENDNVARYDVPIIMTPEKAFVYAARALYDAYSGAVFHEMRLSSKYLRLEPGDVLAITMNAMDYVLKVTEGTINSDWSMQILGTSFCDLSAISTTGEAPLNIGSQLVAGPSLTQGFIVDTPPLIPEDCAGVIDTNLRIYAEITSYGQAGWRGGRLSTAAVQTGPYGVVWSDTVTGGSYVGIAVTGISGGLASTTDLFTTLTVNFTVMPTALTGSSGFMLLGKPNRWEFMSYGSAIASTGSSREYTFTGLVRGLRGTEWHMRDHEAGDAVLLYPNPAHLVTLISDITLASDVVYYKAFGTNEEEATTPPRSFTMAQNFEKPWAPTSLKAHTVSGGSSALTLSWMRRTRLEYNPLGTTAAQPLEPGWTEAYEIDILGATGNVLRTVTGALTNSYTYASGDVTTDFGGVPATLSFNVYQISPVVGRGFAGSTTTDVLSAT